MTELSYNSIRSANQAREADEQKQEARKKNLLILILQYLNDEGYIESSQSLSRETNIDVTRFDVCDNIDLPTILMEYESYYYVKFAKYPRITKKLTQSAEERKPISKHQQRLKRSVTCVGPGWTQESNRAGSTPSLPRIPQNQAPGPPPGRPKSGTQSKGRNGSNQSTPKKDQRQVQTNGAASQSEQSLQGLMVQGSNSNTDNSETPVKTDKPRPGQIIDFRAMLNDATKMNSEEGADGSDRLLKPLGGYMGYSNEWRDLAQTISRDIYSQNPNVRWDDIIGLERAKRLAKEAVVYPIKYPQLFTGILSPWKGLLLYGPPGTGKTLLAKAIATECNTTFFNISASSIVSKWRGDSEKLVRVLFELARYYAPSTIFLDELESLMSQRGSSGGGGEHEGSRRMKTELLVQMDGLAKTDDLVFLLAASNIPWELDHAMLRRLEKRILVDLPTQEARKAMFYHHLPPIVCSEGSHGIELDSDLDYDRLAMLTEGYSGSDIRLLSKEAAMRPVRKIFDALENHGEGDELHINLDTITTEDVEAALLHTKPSARGMTGKYMAWQQEYESS